MMSMAVDDRLHMLEAVDRLGQALRAEILEDLGRFADQRIGDRRIMEDGDAAVGAQRPKRILELARFLHRLVDECLDDRLAKGRELAAAESAEETLDAGK